MTLSQSKIRKIKVIKQLAIEAIEETASDWMILRHMDQIALSEPLSLTENELQALRVQRQNIRRKSDSLEASVNAIQKVAEVEAFVIRYDSDN